MKFIRKLLLNRPTKAECEEQQQQQKQEGEEQQEQIWGRRRWRRAFPGNVLSLLLIVRTCLMFKKHRLMSISHFRVPPGLCIKTRWSAQPLIWKDIFILLQIKLIFTSKVVHLASNFESEGFWNSEVAYSRQTKFATETFPIFIIVQLRCKSLQTVMHYSFLLFTFSGNFERNANTEKLESCFHLRISLFLRPIVGSFKWLCRAS